MSAPRLRYTKKPAIDNTNRPLGIQLAHFRCKIVSEYNLTSGWVGTLEVAVNAPPPLKSLRNKLSKLTVFPNHNSCHKQRTCRAVFSYAFRSSRNGFVPVATKYSDATLVVDYQQHRRSISDLTGRTQEPGFGESLSDCFELIVVTGVISRLSYF